MLTRKNAHSNQTMPVPTTDWLAAYLYYAEPWEAFLTEAVGPFIEKVMAAQRAEQYFFIRYWERGPHVRLRFKGEPGVLEEKVKPALIAHFEAYFEAHPSERLDPQWVNDLSEEGRWYPNNTIQFIPYEPEVDRYAGPEGLLIAERQFEASTRAVLAIIEANEGWSYDRALGAGIQLHLGFAHALGMPLEEAAQFYVYIYRGWFARSYGFHQGLSEEERVQRQEETQALFDKQFAQQSGVLIPYHETLWQALEDGVEFTSKWLNRWIDEMRDVGVAFREAQAEGRLDFSQEWHPHDPKRGIPVSQQVRWSVLGSYVHMTNNRLGILNRDEAFLGYLIQRCLRELRPSAQPEQSTTS